MKVFLSLLVALGFMAQANADIKIVSVERASAVTQMEDGYITRILGGIAGDPYLFCQGLGSDTLCNTCKLKSFACNEKRIHSNLELRVTFEVTGDISGVVAVGFETSGSYISVTPTSVTSGTLSRGDTGVVDIEWSDICQEATGTSSCDLMGGRTNLVIGLGPNPYIQPKNYVATPVVVAVPNADPMAANGYDQVQCADTSPSTGICNLNAFPGDGKVFIDELQEVGAYPLSNTLGLKALRVFYSDVSFAEANYSSQNYHDFELGDNGIPASDIIDGLENGITYFFRPAVVDEANNVAFLVSEEEIESDAECAANADLGCGLIATPDKVNRIDNALHLLGL